MSKFLCDRISKFDYPPDPLENEQLELLPDVEILYGIMSDDTRKSTDGFIGSENRIDDDDGYDYNMSLDADIPTFSRKSSLDPIIDEDNSTSVDESNVKIDQSANIDPRYDILKGLDENSPYIFHGSKVTRPELGTGLGTLILESMKKNKDRIYQVNVLLLVASCRTPDSFFSIGIEC